jgi:hypothetical protein
MTTKNNGDSARVAELELENDQLKQRLEQREHDAAEIADALREAQRNSGGGRWQTKTYLLIFWAVVGVRVLATNYCHWLTGGFLGVLIEVVFVGAAAGTLWRWASGEILRDLGGGLVKNTVMLIGLFVAAMMYSHGDLLQGTVFNPEIASSNMPLWVFLWVSLIMLLMLSPFCQWLRRSVVNLAQRRSSEPQDSYDVTEEAYDGLGEN